MKLFLISLFTTAFFLTVSAGSHAQDNKTSIIKTRTVFVLKADFSQPSDVAVSSDGRIYVLDGVNGKVKVFSNKGLYLFTFGKNGQGCGEFSLPLGIFIDQNGLVYVADSGNHRVQILSSSGVFIEQFSTETGGDKLKPSDPTDVVVNNKLKRCFVVDNDNHRVLIYDLTQKKLVATAGRIGAEKSELRYPFLADINSAGNVFISEVINTRVKVLDPEGNYITNIGGWGVEPGELFRPKGVGVSPDNKLFVTDSYMGVIQEFDCEGRFTGVVGDMNGSVRKFISPTGIWASKDRLYIVEMTADRVTVLERIGE